MEGEARIIGDVGIGTNPTPVKWGTAPVLIQSTLKPGKVKITASVWFKGSQMPTSAVLELESKPATYSMFIQRKKPLLYLWQVSQINQLTKQI